MLCNDRDSKYMRTVKMFVGKPTIYFEANADTLTPESKYDVSSHISQFQPRNIFEFSSPIFNDSENDVQPENVDSESENEFWLHESKRSEHSPPLSPFLPHVEQSEPDAPLSPLSRFTQSQAMHHGFGNVEESDEDFMDYPPPTPLRSVEHTPPRSRSSVNSQSRPEENVRPRVEAEVPRPIPVFTPPTEAFRGGIKYRPLYCGMNLANMPKDSILGTRAQCYRKGLMYGKKLAQHG